MIGEGGFGEVWQCLKKLGKKRYAVKIIKFEFLQDEDFNDINVIKEFENCQSLEHPNVVK
jgi:serine/threonine protein kinase